MTPRDILIRVCSQPALPGPEAIIAALELGGYAILPTVQDGEVAGLIERLTAAARAWNEKQPGVAIARWLADAIDLLSRTEAARKAAELRSLTEIGLRGMAEAERDELGEHALKLRDEYALYRIAAEARLATAEGLLRRLHIVREDGIATGFFADGDQLRFAAECVAFLNEAKP